MKNFLATLTASILVMACGDSTDPSMAEYTDHAITEERLLDAGGEWTMSVSSTEEIMAYFTSIADSTESDSTLFNLTAGSKAVNLYLKNDLKMSFTKQGIYFKMELDDGGKQAFFNEVQVVGGEIILGRNIGCELVESVGCSSQLVIKGEISKDYLVFDKNYWSTSPLSNGREIFTRL